LSTVSQIEERAASRLAHGGLPVIALGGGVTLSAVLGLLNEAQVTTYAVTPADDIATHSRWFYALPDCGADPQPTELEDLLHHTSLDSAVLIPCADDWLRAVAGLPTSLSRRFPSSTAPVLAVNLMTNKWRFAQLLDRLSIPHPKTRLLRSAGQLSELPTSVFDGAILKPVSSVEFARRHGVKGFLVQSREEAQSRMAGVEYPIMLQEFIPGPPSAGYFLEGFVNGRGEVRARFARQRLRMYPPDLGNSTLMVSVPLEQMKSVFEDLDILFATTAYRGIFNAEFKLDPRDGLFKLIEINARPWWYIEFAARCGIDVCLMMYRDAMGLPVEAVEDYETGSHCVLAVNDFLGWRHQGEKRGSLFSWARPWWGARSALFHCGDPGPGVAYGWRMLKQWLCRPAGTQESTGKDAVAGRAPAAVHANPEARKSAKELALR
jgi:D-aspartate ligase